jgi:proteasome lid subunit RPN8/RPN11
MNKKENLIRFENIKDVLNFLKREGDYSLLAELCGLVGLDEHKNIVYKQMQNRSKNPEAYFLIDPFDYLSFIKDFEILMIYHTHLCGDEFPSDFDEKTSENCCLPFLIYSVSTEKFFIYEPTNKDYDVNIIQRLKELI